MRVPAKSYRPKPKPAIPSSFPAPTRGWVANENLANPTDGGAAAMENWFATATGVRVRSGSELYATLGDGDLPVTSLWSYLNGEQEEFFGSTEGAAYNLTTVYSPINVVLSDEDDMGFETDDGDILAWGSTTDLKVMDTPGGGPWVVVQFATAGGVFLIGVNGETDGFLYNGQYYFPEGASGVWTLAFDAQTSPFTAGEVVTGGTSGATATIYRVVAAGGSGSLQLVDLTGGPFQDNEALTDTGGGAATANGASSQVVLPITGVAVSDLSFVWVYKQRLWFVEKNSLNAWYLGTNAVSGPATKLPLGGVFGRGGSLLFGATWSLDSGAEGGLSEQCVFVSTEGEVAVYQGSDPSDADTWSKVGVYRIGRPLGPKAFIRAGGDLVIATDIGFIPLSQAIQRDVAALSPVAVSYLIETAWNDRVAARSGAQWHAELWPTKQMSVIALPTTPDTKPEMLITNARTGAWSLYTGWDGTCMEVFKERLFYGSQNGLVVEAEVTGADQGAPYTALCVPLFSDLGSPGVLKMAGQARAVLLSPYPVADRITMQADFALNIPPPPDAAGVGSGSVWGLGVWGQATWGQEALKKPFQNWRSTAGYGYAFAPALQITSGSVPPPSVDLVRIDVITQRADIGS